MDGQVGQGYLSLRPQSNYSNPLRMTLSNRILALCACVVLVTVGTLIAGFNREHALNSTGEFSALSTLPSTHGGIRTPFQPRTLMSGASPVDTWKNLALSALEASTHCDRVNARDVSLQASMSSIDTKNKAQLAKLAKKIVVRAEGLKAAEMSGVTGPLGFFDPVGFSTDIPEGKLLFYREVELKHGRLCMLASLGILVAESFHPLFGGNIDAPAAFAFQQTPLQQFWQAVLAALFATEFASIQSFQPIWDGGALWQMRTDRAPGDFGFDPFGLKPSNEKEFKELQTKELNNGRLAMIAAAGMIAQELATGKTIF